MTNHEWWAHEDNELGQLEAADSFWEALYGRKVDGEWEYSITRWRHGNPSRIVSFKAGKFTFNMED